MFDRGDYVRLSNSNDVGVILQFDHHSKRYLVQITTEDDCAEILTAYLEKPINSRANLIHKASAHISQGGAKEVSTLSSSFSHVEQLSHSSSFRLVRESALQPMLTGNIARLKDLVAARSANGLIVQVGMFDPGTMRYEVQMDSDGSIKKVREENLDIIERWKIYATLCPSVAQLRSVALDNRPRTAISLIKEWRQCPLPVCYSTGSMARLCEFLVDSTHTLCQILQPEDTVEGGYVTNRSYYNESSHVKGVHSSRNGMKSSTWYTKPAPKRSRVVSVPDTASIISRRLQISSPVSPDIIGKFNEEIATLNLKQKTLVKSLAINISELGADFDAVHVIYISIPRTQVNPVLGRDSIDVNMIHRNASGVRADQGCKGLLDLYEDDGEFYEDVRPLTCVIPHIAEIGHWIEDSNGVYFKGYMHKPCRFIIPTILAAYPTLSVARAAASTGIPFYIGLSPVFIIFLDDRSVSDDEIYLTGPQRMELMIAESLGKSIYVYDMRKGLQRKINTTNNGSFSDRVRYLILHKPTDGVVDETDFSGERIRVMMETCDPHDESAWGTRSVKCYVV